VEIRTKTAHISADFDGFLRIDFGGVGAKPDELAREQRDTWFTRRLI